MLRRMNPDRSHRQDLPDARSNIALLGLGVLAPIGIMTGHWSDFSAPNLLPQGQLSIDIFFAIEGFFAAGILLRAGSGTSYWSLMGQRLLKIYPLYLLGILLSLVLVIPHALHGASDWTPATVQEAFLMNAALLPSFALYSFAVFPFNPPTWAIALEVYAFALFCLMRRHLTPSRLLVFTIAVAIAYVLLALMAHDTNMGFRARHYWGGYGRCLFGFAWGVLLYHVLRRLGPVLPSLNPLLIWAAFIGILFIDIPQAALPIGIIAMPLLVWLAAASTNPSWLEGIARQAGRLSYGVYLLHYPILLSFHHAAEDYRVPAELLATPWYYLLVLSTVILAAHVATGLLTWTGSSAARLYSMRHG